MRNEGKRGFSRRDLVKIGLLVAGIALYGGRENFAPETASPTELTGPGYSIKYSDKAPAYMRIEGVKREIPLLEVEGRGIFFNHQGRV